MQKAPAKGQAPKEIRCAIYCRISLSRFGDTVKVDDQERVCRDLVAARGWTVSDAHVYKDNSISAWRWNVRRPGWEAMLAAVNAGEVNGIVVYHGDRMIRNPYDLEILIRLANDKGIRLASPTGQRDLDNEDDRFILRIESAAASREVGATSRRMKHMFDRMAEQGKCRLGGRGGRAFGFEPDGMTVREADKEMLGEVAERILRREAMGEIVRDLNTRGLRTTTGGEWTHGALKRLMLRPRLAGLLARHGQIVGPAAWPAILDRETWEAVCAVLDGKEQTFGYTTNARKYLLSGIALCGSCGRPVAIRHNARSKTLRGYGCIAAGCPKKVHRSQVQVDAFVEGAVVGLLRNPAVRKAMAPATSSHLVDELEALTARRERKLLDFAEDDSPLAADVLRVVIAKIDRRVGEVRAEMVRARLTSAVDGLWGLTVEQFRSLPLGRRRDAVQAFLRVTILPAGRRGPGFDPASVRLERVSRRG